MRGRRPSSFANLSANSRAVLKVSSLAISIEYTPEIERMVALYLPKTFSHAVEISPSDVVAIVCFNRGPVWTAVLACLVVGTATLELAELAAEAWPAAGHAGGTRRGNAVPARDRALRHRRLPGVLRARHRRVVALVPVGDHAGPSAAGRREHGARVHVRRRAGRIRRPAARIAQRRAAAARRGAVRDRLRRVRVLRRLAVRPHPGRAEDLAQQDRRGNGGGHARARS